MGNEMIQLSEQVKKYVATLPPESRRKIRDALRALEQGRGEMTPLTDDLEGFHRLKLPPRRIIFHYKASKSGPVCHCDFIEMRAVVYEQFSALVSQGEV